MGTRADFYIGNGLKAKWLGSIAWDGYPKGIPNSIKSVTDKEIYREVVADFLKDREDATLPEMGWPWPWEDSSTTDYAYSLKNGKVSASYFGGQWFDPSKKQPERKTGYVKFPNMRAIQKVDYGKRSGLIILTAAK